MYIYKTKVTISKTPMYTEEHWKVIYRKVIGDFWNYRYSLLFFNSNFLLLYLPFLKKDFIYLVFRERGRAGETEGEKCWYVVASHVPPTGDQACNPGMCPDWELNQQSFGSQSDAQSTEPHQPGLLFYNL